MSTFKVGDRVGYFDGLDRDTGVIARSCNSATDRWWVKWDSDGKVQWALEKNLTLIDDFTKCLETITPTKTKSDGGSSDYYKLEINGNLVEVEDIIYAMVGGDFALGNVIKACRRMYLDSKGQGKEGVDMTYDANKIKFFVDSFKKRFGGKND